MPGAAVTVRDLITEEERRARTAAHARSNRVTAFSPASSTSTCLRRQVLARPPPYTPHAPRPIRRPNVSSRIGDPRIASTFHQQAWSTQRFRSVVRGGLQPPLRACANTPQTKGRVEQCGKEPSPRRADAHIRRFKIGWSRSFVPCRVEG